LGVAYLATIEQVKACPNMGMPSLDVDELHRREPGFILATAAAIQDEIDAQLRKRYPVPYAAPVPFLVLGWMGALLTPVLFDKRGVNPSDEQQERIDKRAEKAREQITEAADAVNGKWDLVLRADTAASGLQQPEPLSYSEQSAYTSKHLQADAIRANRRYG
jgi:hypothetical protein